MSFLCFPVLARAIFHAVLSSLHLLLLSLDVDGIGFSLINVCDEMLKVESDVGSRRIPNCLVLILRPPFSHTYLLSDLLRDML